MCMKGTFSETSIGRIRRGKVLIEPVVDCRRNSAVKRYNINDPDCPQHMKNAWKRMTGKDGM